MFAELSNALLLVPFAFALWLYVRDRRRFFSLLSAYLFLAAVVIGVKFALRVPRPGYEEVFDPFSFPSFHTAFLAALAWFAPPLPALLLAGVMGVLRVLAGVHTWLDVLGGLLFGLFVPYIFFQLRKRIGKEADRQAFHMGAAVLFALLSFRAPSLSFPLLSALLILGIFLYTVRRREPVKEFLDVYDRKEGGRGAFTLVLGLLVVSLLRPDVVWIAAFFVAYVDGLATISGKLAGTRKKSFYGLVGAFFGALFAWACTRTVFWSLLVVPFVELLTPKPLDDNVTIPLAVLALQYL